jgi:hypothetical protein
MAYIAEPTIKEQASQMMPRNFFPDLSIQLLIQEYHLMWSSSTTDRSMTSSAGDEQ